MAIISTLQPLLVQLPYQVLKLHVSSLAMVPWWKSLGIWNLRPNFFSRQDFRGAIGHFDDPHGC